MDNQSDNNYRTVVTELMNENNNLIVNDMNPTNIFYKNIVRKSYNVPPT